MKVRVNGTDHQLGDTATVAEVLTLLSAPSKGIAVALDGAVVPRASWAETRLREGSVVEVLTAVQGG